MSQLEKACRTCGTLNVASAYACSSCGISLRLSPPMRPAPALRPPIVAPKSSSANDTLDIETEFPDEEFDQLLVSHTPAPRAELMDQLTTLDEATDGLAPSIAFDDLEVLSPGTNMPPLRRKEPSLQDSISIDPLHEFPQNTEILRRPTRATRFGARGLILLIGIIGLGAMASKLMVDPQKESQSALGEKRYVPQKLPQTYAYGTVNVHADLSALISLEVGIDPVVLKAQAKAWSRVNDTLLKHVSSGSSEPLNVLKAQLSMIESQRFEQQLATMNDPTLNRKEQAQTLSIELQKIEEQLTQIPQDIHGTWVGLRLWLYSLQGKHQQAGELSKNNDQIDASLSWTKALPMLSMGDTRLEVLNQLREGVGCEREFYLLRAHELAKDYEELGHQYERFSDCLTQLIAQEHLTLSTPSPRAQSKMRVGSKRRAHQANDPVPTGGYEALMTQGVKALERGRVTQAENYFNRANSLNPKQPDPWSQLGWCALAKGQAKRSLNLFKTALSYHSKHADSLYGLGYAYEQLKSWDTARGHYQRYLSLYPTGPKVRIIENKLNQMPK